jgi:hypothetical protein
MSVEFLFVAVAASGPGVVGLRWQQGTPTLPEKSFSFYALRSEAS